MALHDRPGHIDSLYPSISGRKLVIFPSQVKDDPYNFSEEEDVFSPQLPSRQFSSSNATTHQPGELAGTDSNDPAMERLKAEHR